MRRAVDRAPIYFFNVPMTARRPEMSVRARPAAPPPLDFGGAAEAVAAAAEALRLAHGHRFNPAFAAETARIDPLPHQRIAVYERMLPQDPLRFLLADDAGAGKTIMTGLYIREMLLRERLRRALIVPPAGLVGNWERELRTLFGLRFRVAFGPGAAAGNPFLGAGSDLVIVSLDTLRGARGFAALRAPGVRPYELIAFDEAHKLSAATAGGRTRKRRRYELAEALAGAAPARDRFAGLGWAARHLLLLTATPHMGRDSPWHHLWRLLDARVFATAEALRRFPAADRDRHFIRRAKEEMVALDGTPLYLPRVCDTFSYDLTPGPGGEQALYDATTEYLRRSWDRALRNRPAVQLAMCVFQRRLASSTWALLRSFERRIGKLRRAAEDLRAGHADAAELARRQRLIDRDRGEDFFDTHGADEDSGEDAERYEDAVLGATVAVTVEELQREIDALEALRARARSLADSASESKFGKLREVLDDPAYAGEKWLIFSEHRDTADWLARRLEGIGHGGRVARIHGGMGWPEREEQTARFRDPGGARFLVATDAAGEGVNLQFCRLTVNYDVPWNPARLEQRMGRVHRYGQRREVRVVNLVAGATHEGRVLRTLLEKLEAIRRELRSDKVFDVIGRLFENESLRDYMARALDAEGERRAAACVERALDADRARALQDAEKRIPGPGGEVAERLGDLRAGLARERYLHLLPWHVRSFVVRAAALLGLDVRGDLDGAFALAPRAAGAPHPLRAALETYPRAARERLRVRRPGRDEACVWLHPGEPVFDALAARVSEACGRDALRGAVFADPRAEAPYMVHLAELRAAEDGETGAESRLLALRQGADGELRDWPAGELLLLRAAREIPPGAAALAARANDMRARAAEHAARAAEALAQARRERARAALPERRRLMRASFDLRAAELSARGRALRRAARPENAEAREALRGERAALAAERQGALAALEAEPDRIAPGSVRFAAHALIVPAADAEERAHGDARVEEMAVALAAAWERERGAGVRDVSRPELARAAGLPDAPGFDLLAARPGGEERCIEVKGRAGRGAVELTANEWRQACHLGDRYWLYVAFDCATPAPTLLRIRNPFSKLLAGRRESEAWTIPAARLRAAAERG